MGEATEVPALSVRSLRFAYPRTRGRPSSRALDGVTFELAPGQAAAILGPNGSGKSTLMRLICGALPLPGGTIEIFGRRLGVERRGELGVVFQTTSLDRHLTVRENLRLQAKLYGIRREDAASRISRDLELAGLADRSGALVKTLSHGLARRVDLCRALLHRPRLLVLDEPTAGLDPTARLDFQETLGRRREAEGLTVVLSTHLVDEADRLDRVIMLHRGRIVADDTPAGLLRRLGRLTVRVRDADWRPNGDEEGWQRRRDGWLLALDGVNERLALLAARLDRDGVRYSIAPPTLADAFEDLTGHGIDTAPKDAAAGAGAGAG